MINVLIPVIVVAGAIWIAKRSKASSGTVTPQPGPAEPSTPILPSIPEVPTLPDFDNPIIDPSPPAIEVPSTPVLPAPVLPTPILSPPIDIGALPGDSAGTRTVPYFHVGQTVKRKPGFPIYFIDPVRYDNTPPGGITKPAIPTGTVIEVVWIDKKWRYLVKWFAEYTSLFGYDSTWCDESTLDNVS